MNVIKSVLNLDKTPPGPERSFNIATKFKRELTTDLEMESIPLMKLLPLAEAIHTKTQEIPQNTDLDTREFLGINKALQTIQGKLVNNTSKLTDINECIKKESKKLKEVQEYPTHSEEQRQFYKNRLDDLNTEKQTSYKYYHKKEKILRGKLQG